MTIAATPRRSFSGSPSPTPRAGRKRRRGIAGSLLVAVCVGCGPRTTPPPEPGTTRGVSPDLRGVRVLLLPVQQNLAVRGDPDAELSYTLRERGQGILWVSSDDVDAMLARNPAMQARTRGLPVGAFLQAEVERVGDPLYGELRRAASLVDAAAVFIPVQASLEALPGEDPKVRFTSTLIDVRTGRVMWFGVLEGGAYPAGDPRGLASAVEVLARTLIWYVSP